MRVGGYILGGAGLVMSLVGTFLPWLRSGDVQRNSYASFAVLRRLVGFRGLSEALLRAWPLLGVACAVVVLAAVAGLHRTSAVLALVTAGWAGAVGAAALTRDPVAGVSVEAIGPVVTVTGAAVLTAAAILTLTAQTRTRCTGGRRP